MVSYYNQMAIAAYNQKSNLPYSPSQPWYPNYHQPHNAFTDSENHAMYYSNPHMFHQASPDWTADNYPASHTSILQASQAAIHLNQHTANNDHINDGINSVPSPPITVAGSEMSSPGAPNSNGSPHNPRPTPAKSPYEWMKKASYQNQINPENWSMNSGKAFGILKTEIEDDSSDINYIRRKTRTKDKYRVVYSDYQRLELEKEYHTSRYITIRRKSELATSLQLSERQVKIWFQNRRAKERKQSKKRDDTSTPGSMNSMTHQNPSMSHLVDVKPKIEPGLNIHQHPLHQMSAMSLGMTSMGLHPSLHHMGVPTSQHLHAAHAAHAHHAQQVQAHVQAQQSAHAQAQAQAQSQSPTSLNI